MTSDETVQQRMAAADPAARLAPLDAADRAALPDTATDRAPRRLRILALGLGVGAAAIACAVVGAVVLLPRPEPVVLTLEVPDDGLADCMSLSAAFVPILREETDVAFLGRVLQIDQYERGVETGNDVVIEPTSFFRGGPADLVRLRVPQEEDSVMFQDGEEFLVSGATGRTFGCGLSGPDESELHSYYDRAFR